MGGYLPLAPAVSSVRYPIRQRTFKYVAMVQGVTDEMCQKRKLKSDARVNRSPISCSVSDEACVTKNNGCAGARAD